MTDAEEATASSSLPFDYGMRGQEFYLDADFATKSFDLHRPKGIRAGLWMGGKSVMSGFSSGMYALFTQPFKSSDPKQEWYEGLAKALKGATLFPAAGVGVATYQVGRGLANTYEECVEMNNGKDYNEATGEWFEYRLEVDVTSLATIETPTFVRPAMLGADAQDPKEQLMQQAVDGIVLFDPYIGAPDFESAVAWLKELVSQAESGGSSGLPEGVSLPVLGESPAQCKRQVTLALQLVERVAAYVAGDIDDFERTAREEAKKLAGVPFGAHVLFVVAELYTACAEEFAGYHTSPLGMGGVVYSANFKALQAYNKATFSKALLGGMGTLIASIRALSQDTRGATDEERASQRATQIGLARVGLYVAFSWLVLDLEHALGSAVAKAVRDHGVEEATRIARAQAISRLGAICMEEATAAGGSKDPRGKFDELVAQLGLSDEVTDADDGTAMAAATS